MKSDMFEIAIILSDLRDSIKTTTSSFLVQVSNYFDRNIKPRKIKYIKGM